MDDDLDDIRKRLEADDRRDAERRKAADERARKLKETIDRVTRSTTELQEKVNGDFKKT